MAKKSPLTLYDGFPSQIKPTDTIFDFTVVEIDFGTVQLGEKTFTFTHLGAEVTDIIRAELAYLQPSGKSLDEIEMDSFYILGRVSAPDTITLLIRVLSGTVQNKFKFRYQILKG